MLSLAPLGIMMGARPDGGGGGVGGAAHGRGCGGGVLAGLAARAAVSEPSSHATL